MVTPLQFFIFEFLEKLQEKKSKYCTHIVYSSYWNLRNFGPHKFWCRNTNSARSRDLKLKKRKSGECASKMLFKRWVAQSRKEAPLLFYRKHDALCLPSPRAAGEPAEPGPGGTDDQRMRFCVCKGCSLCMRTYIWPAILESRPSDRTNPVTHRHFL